MLPILFRWVEMVGWVEMMMLLVSLVGWWCLSEISDKMMLGWNTWKLGSHCLFMPSKTIPDLRYFLKFPASVTCL